MLNILQLEADLRSVTGRRARYSVAESIDSETGVPSTIVTVDPDDLSFDDLRDFTQRFNNDGAFAVVRSGQCG